MRGSVAVSPRMHFQFPWTGGGKKISTDMRNHVSIAISHAACSSDDMVGSARTNADKASPCTREQILRTNIRPPSVEGFCRENPAQHCFLPHAPSFKMLELLSWADLYPQGERHRSIYGQQGKLRSS